jgi:hypothetical protein
VDLNLLENRDFAKRRDQQVQRDLHINDIIEASLDAKAKSQTIIHMIKRMKNEITSNYFENPSKEFNLYDLYKIFVLRRKMKLLRFLF